MLLIGLVLGGLLLKNSQAMGYCDCQFGIDVLLLSGLNVGLQLTPSNGSNGWQLVNQASPQFKEAGQFIVSLPAMYKSNQLFEVPKGCGELLQVSTQASFHDEVVIGQVSSPLGFDQDPYYGYGAIGFNDYSGFAFEIWFTNTKVYALYSRLSTTQSATNYYASFTYLVPIGDKTPGSADVYEVVLEGARRSVSYRMNEFEMLRIEQVGKGLDDKFMIADYGGYWELDGFPDIVYAIAGTGAAISMTGAPHPACQRTLYNACIDSPKNAKNSHCQYAPRPLENTFDYIMNITGIFDEIYVTAGTKIETCPEWTCQKPATFCHKGDRHD